MLNKYLIVQTWQVNIRKFSEKIVKIQWKIFKKLLTKCNLSVIINNVKRDESPETEGEFEMVVATYRTNSRQNAEEILVLKDQDTGILTLEMINATEFGSIPGEYHNLQEVEAALAKRNPDGYRLIVARRDNI